MISITIPASSTNKADRHLPTALKGFIQMSTQRPQLPNKPISNRLEKVLQWPGEPPRKRAKVETINLLSEEEDDDTLQLPNPPHRPSAIGNIPRPSSSTKTHQVTPRAVSGTSQECPAQSIKRLFKNSISQNRPQSSRSKDNHLSSSGFIGPGSDHSNLSRQHPDSAFQKTVFSAPSNDLPRHTTDPSCPITVSSSSSVASSHANGDTTTVETNANESTSMGRSSTIYKADEVRKREERKQMSMHLRAEAELRRQVSNNHLFTSASTSSANTHILVNPASKQDRQDHNKRGRTQVAGSLPDSHKTHVQKQISGIAVEKGTRHKSNANIQDQAPPKQENLDRATMQGELRHRDSHDKFKLSTSDTRARLTQSRPPSKSENVELNNLSRSQSSVSSDIRQGRQLTEPAKEANGALTLLREVRERQNRKPVVAPSHPQAQKAVTTTLQKMLHAIQTPKESSGDRAAPPSSQSNKTNISPFLQTQTNTANRPSATSDNYRGNQSLSPDLRAGGPKNAVKAATAISISNPEKPATSNPTPNVKSEAFTAAAENDLRGKEAVISDRLQKRLEAIHKRQLRNARNRLPSPEQLTPPCSKPTSPLESSLRPDSSTTAVSRTVKGTPQSVPTQPFLPGQDGTDKFGSPQPRSASPLQPPQQSLSSTLTTPSLPTQSTLRSDRPVNNASEKESNSDYGMISYTAAHEIITSSTVRQAQDSQVKAPATNRQVVDGSSAAFERNVTNNESQPKSLVPGRVGASYSCRANTSGNELQRQINKGSIIHPLDGSVTKRSHKRRLGEITAEDAALILWTNHTLDWKYICRKFSETFHKQRVEDTLRARVKQVRMALDYQNITDKNNELLQQSAAGDPAALEELNRLVYGCLPSLSDLTQSTIEAGQERSCLQNTSLGVEKHYKSLGPSSATKTLTNVAHVQIPQLNNTAVAGFSANDVDRTHTQENPHSQQDARPTLGGKTINYETLMRVFLSHEEAQRETSPSLYTPCPERASSPFVDEDYCHFAYQVERREFPASQLPQRSTSLNDEQMHDGRPSQTPDYDEDDTPWISCGSPLSALHLANAHAAAEATRPPYSFASPGLMDSYTLSSTKTDAGLARLSFTCPGLGVVQTRVNRFMRTFHDGVKPDVKLHWAPREVFVVKEQSFLCKEDSHEDAGLFVEEAKEEWEVEGEDVVVGEGVYTVVGLANARAIERFVARTVKCKGNLSKWDVEKRAVRVELEESFGVGGDGDAEDWGDVVDLFDRTEEVTEAGRKKRVRVWVAKMTLEGPRNL